MILRRLLCPMPVVMFEEPFPFFPRWFTMWTSEDDKLLFLR